MKLIDHLKRLFKKKDTRTVYQIYNEAKGYYWGEYHNPVEVIEHTRDTFRDLPQYRGLYVRCMEMLDEDRMVLKGFDVMVEEGDRLIKDIYLTLDNLFNK